jgi:hypothetical protein
MLRVTQGSAHPLHGILPEGRLAAHDGIDSSRLGSWTAARCKLVGGGPARSRRLVPGAELPVILGRACPRAGVCPGAAAPCRAKVKTQSA